MKKYRYEVKGMSCAACVAHVEKAAHRAIDDTCQNITVSLLTNSITFESGDEADCAKIEKDLAAALHAGGYELVTGKEEDRSEKKKENIGRYLTDITFLLVMFCGSDSKDKENKCIK